MPDELLFETSKQITLPPDIRDSEGRIVKLSLDLALNVVRPPPGGGGSLTLAPDAGTGPVFTDDFGRADSDTPGNGWVEYGADFDIVSGALECSLAAGSIRACQQEGASGGAMFVQGSLWSSFSGSSRSLPKLAARMAATATHPQDCYCLRMDERLNVIQLFRVVGGTFTELASAAATLATQTFYPVQLYVADGVQQGAIVSDGGAIVTLSAADTAHDGQDSRFPGVIAQASPNGTFTHRYDNFGWPGPSPSISVSGLSDGQKAKVLNTSAEVVAGATESGGTATVDCSLFGGATEIMPLAGWDALIVTDADDVELARYDAAGIFPGYAYAAS